jgi:membrane dipeptidase
MANAAFPLVFDGHNDTLLSLPGREPGTARDFFERSDRGHIDLPRAQEGGLGGGFFAVFVPGQRPPGTDGMAAYRDPATRPPTPELDEATRVSMRMAANLFHIEEQSAGRVKIVRTADELAAGLAKGTFCAILHFEGAEAIDEDLNALEVYYQAGLRSIGPVWSRANIFAEGVPFKFGETPDTGPGLTDAGKALVRECNRLGIMLDLSHMNEKGFWDVAAITDAPIVATHSNAWALSASPRNLTDRQLAAIKESDGMVGVNFSVGFLGSDGSRDTALPIETMVRHFDYLVEHLGIDRVGFGSDFDGTTVPDAVGDASGLPVVLNALKERGYDSASLRKLAHENWIRVLRKTWKA